VNVVSSTNCDTLLEAFVFQLDTRQLLNSIRLWLDRRTSALFQKQICREKYAPFNLSFPPYDYIARLIVRNVKQRIRAMRTSICANA